VDDAARLMVTVLLTDRNGREVAVAARPGWSLMESIRDLEASVEAICGGMCACSTCHVYIAPEWVPRLPPRSYEEHVMLHDLPSFDPERSRLSCQIIVTEELDGLAVTVAPSSL